MIKYNIHFVVWDRGKYLFIHDQPKNIVKNENKRKIATKSILFYSARSSVF